MLSGGKRGGGEIAPLAVHAPEWNRGTNGQPSDKRKHDGSEHAWRDVADQHGPSLVVCSVAMKIGAISPTLEKRIGRGTSEMPAEPSNVVYIMLLIGSSEGADVAVDVADWRGAPEMRQRRSAESQAPHVARSRAGRTPQPHTKLADHLIVLTG